MSRVWVGIIAGVGGFLAGLYAAKLYAKSTLTTDVNGLLGDIGLGGGKVQSIVDNTLIPLAVN
jgi:hypothetical protein